MQAADTRNLDRRCSASDIKRKFVKFSGEQNECRNGILEPFDVKTSWWRCRTSLESPLISQTLPVDMLAQTLNNLSNAVVVYFRRVDIFPCVTATWACWFTSLKPETSVNLRGRS